ncbi:MAG: DNA mismatch repair protein MutS, partial [Clostridiaceae bacterium]|nr:DNA mismatch repair protein MutS [Clostridiaceae bacterium]
MNSLTPMMQQYMEIKEQYKDCILFFRLGDFYEMFFDDAATASRELEIALTGRDCGLEERAPMCGVPFHSVEPYIAKLVSKGYKVAICEQVEDPALAKGIVKREVIRVITPGTVIESSILDEKKNNYLLSVYEGKGLFGLAFSDVSTGEFHATQIIWGNTTNKLIDEIGKYSPAEIITNASLYDNEKIMGLIKNKFNAYVYRFDDDHFIYENAAKAIESCINNVDIIKSGKELAIRASGALLTYIRQTQKADFSHIQDIHLYDIEEYMVLDLSSRRHLELTETMRDMKKKGSLLWVLDRTVTAMGGRTIRRWIEQPLVRIEDIEERLEAVAEMKEKYILRMETMELLKRVYDIERLIGKIAFGNVNCRDLVSLKNSIGQVPFIKNLLERCQSSFVVKNNSRMDTLDDIYELIDKAIMDDPPFMVKEGGIIKDGYNEEVDRLRKISREGKDWIASIEKEEREKTGIKNLRVGYNKVFGYYIEVTKSYYSLVPENYIRKQTLANMERYITPELKEIEDSILGAEEKLMDLEYN